MKTETLDALKEWVRSISQVIEMLPDDAPFQKRQHRMASYELSLALDKEGDEDKASPSTLAILETTLREYESAHRAWMNTPVHTNQLAYSKLLVAKDAHSRAMEAHLEATHRK